MDKAIFVIAPWITVSLALLCSSCSSVLNKSQLNQSVNLTIDAPMHAKIDVDLSKKLTGYASGGYFLHLLRISGDNKYLEGVRFNGPAPGFFSIFSKVNSVKAAAAYNAIRTTQADVLVNPQYVVEENSWNPLYKLIKVKVTGYSGRVISIKNK